LQICDSHLVWLAVDTAPAGDDRSILHPEATSFRMQRHHPSDELAPFVDYLWSVEWERTGQPPHFQKVLPNPCVHLSFEPERARVTGLSRRPAFVYRIDGAGRVLGVRFRPGGARPWYDRPIAGLTDREAPVEELVALDVPALSAAVQAAPDAATAATLVDDALRPLVPAFDPTIDQVSSMVATVAADPAIRRVADLAQAEGLSVRGLQRLCAEWLGVGPTWLVRWARLQEAAGRAAAGPVDWAGLATELGYADQSHLVRDFSRMVGEPPARYARAVSGQTMKPVR